MPRAALATEPKVPMAPASEPALLQASPAPSDPPPATAPAAVNVEDERFASLRRSYMDRLAAMGQAFRELPSRLQQDDMLSYLRLSDGSDEEVRQRAFAIFSETLESAQEHTVSQLQQRLAARDAQVVQLIAERSMGTEVLETARKRLAELEHYEHVAGHWQQRCRPLRDRCVELEEELVSLRDQRATERVALELATQIARDAEQQVMVSKALAASAEAAARQAIEQRANEDSESKWLRQGLSIMLHQLQGVLKIRKEDAEGMFQAISGAELTTASERFVSAIGERIGTLEAADARRTELEAIVGAHSEELREARLGASMTLEHAHQVPLVVVNCR